MLRTLLALAATACLASSSFAQCTVFRGGCSDPTGRTPPQIACNGLPNICCQNFTIDGRGFSTAALGTTLILSDCRTRTPLGPPVGCDVTCVLYLTPLVYVPVTPALGGTISQPFPVPCDPTLVGGQFCVQGAQVINSSTGSICVTLTDAIQITIGPRGTC